MCIAISSPGQFYEQSVSTQSKSRPEMAPRTTHLPEVYLHRFPRKDACFLVCIPARLPEAHRYCKQSPLSRRQLFRYFLHKCTCSDAVWTRFWTYSSLRFVTRVPLCSQIPAYYPHPCPWTLSGHHYSTMVISRILHVRLNNNIWRYTGNLGQSIMNLMHNVWISSLGSLGFVFPLDCHLKADNSNDYC